MYARRRTIGARWREICCEGFGSRRGREVRGSRFEVRVIRGRRVVTPDGTRAAAIHVEDGRIERVAEFGDVPRGAEVVDAGELLVIPGLVDTHVHVNDPGR